MNVKICSKCGKIGLDQIDFRIRWHSQNQKYYYRQECYDCQKQYDKDHLEQAYKRKKQWRKDNVEHYKAWQKQYQKDNAEHRKYQSSKRYQDNKENILEQNKQWKHVNPEKVRAHARKRRALKAGIPGSHTIEELKFIYEMQHGKCSCCGKLLPFEELTEDHIKPVSRPGSTDYAWNIQLLCGQCNSRKFNTHSTDYREVKPVFFSELIRS